MLRYLEWLLVDLTLSLRSLLLHGNDTTTQRRHNGSHAISGSALSPARIANADRVPSPLEEEAAAIPISSRGFRH